MAVSTKDFPKGVSEIVREDGTIIRKRHGRSTNRPKGPKHKNGLGDLVEKLLKWFGITEDVWKQIKDEAGFDPTCGCQHRKAFLNEVPRAMKIGFLRGGIEGAIAAGRTKARELRERYAK